MVDEPQAVVVMRMASASEAAKSVLVIGVSQTRARQWRPVSSGDQEQESGPWPDEHRVLGPCAFLRSSLGLGST